MRTVGVSVESLRSVKAMTSSGTIAKAVGMAVRVQNMGVDKVMRLHIIWNQNTGKCFKAHQASFCKISFVF